MLVLASVVNQSPFLQAPLPSVVLERTASPRGEVVEVGKGTSVSRHTLRRALERVPAKIDYRRHVGSDLFPRPSIRLVEEYDLQIIDTDRTEVRAPEVEQLVARRRTFAGEQVHLVVAIEMVLVRPVTQLHSMEELGAVLH